MGTEIPDSLWEIFRGEIAELLAELEAALLELEARPDDRELLNRIFRTTHTIKGNARMFGLREAAEIAHRIENLYELLRSHQLAVDRGLIDLTLAAVDHLRALAAAGAEQPPDPAMTEQLLEQLQQVPLRVAAGAPAGEPTPPASPARDQPPAGGSGEAGEVLSYRIRFRPAAELFPTLPDLCVLLRELCDLGPCQTTARFESIPKPEEYDPDARYVTWEVTIETDKGREAIRDVFALVEDRCELTIDVVDRPAPAGAPAPAREPPGAPRPSPEERTVRVSSPKLDGLMNQVGELVTVQAGLTRAAEEREDPSLLTIAEQIEQLTAELRDTAFSIRLVPLATTLQRLRRLVRSLSHDTGREVEFVTEGVETELDKTAIEKLNDPLMHLVRNAIDHGIEPPEAREAAGKPRWGRLHLQAEQAGGEVVIRLSDDGTGLDADAVRARAIARGLIAQDAESSEDELLALIFEPGFTTARRVTGVSGRGVGMDVVRRAVESLRGAVDVRSARGAGTTITLRLPLTVAIIEGLLVAVGGERFILPLAAVEECVELTPEAAARAARQRMAHVGIRLIPCVRLRELFHLRETPAAETLVIAHHGGRSFGLLVDAVLGAQQIVIKALGPAYRDVRTVSGASILSDGSVGLILDVRQLIRAAETAEAARSEPQLSVTQTNLTCHVRSKGVEKGV